MAIKKFLLTSSNRAKRLFNIPAKVNTPDRIILEKIIIPFYLSEKNNQRILFVGCAYYTNHYDKYFKKHNYWTIDPDPEQNKFGANNHYITALENIHQIFENNIFDLIICNGVFGYGLNELAQCEQAFENCYNCLKQGGSLVIGWNDDPQFAPLDLDSLTSLGRFQQYKFPAYDTVRYRTKGFANHTYNFYKKSYADSELPFAADSSS